MNISLHQIIRELSFLAMDDIQVLNRELNRELRTKQMYLIAHPELRAGDVVQRKEQLNPDLYGPPRYGTVESVRLKPFNGALKTIEVRWSMTSEHTHWERPWQLIKVTKECDDSTQKNAMST